PLSAASGGGGLFDRPDTNSDGRLSGHELRQLAGLLARLDRDGDGLLAPDEVPRSYQVRFRRGPAGGGFLGDRVFAISGAAGGPPLPALTAGPLWFRKMDRNHDGDVSRREVLGTDAQFRRIDADGDGLHSPDEAAP